MRVVNSTVESDGRSGWSCPISPSLLDDGTRRVIPITCPSTSTNSNSVLQSTFPQNPNQSIVVQQNVQEIHHQNQNQNQGRIVVSSGNISTSSTNTSTNNNGSFAHPNNSTSTCNILGEYITISNTNPQQTTSNIISQQNPTTNTSCTTSTTAPALISSQTSPDFLQQQQQHNELNSKNNPVLFNPTSSNSSTYNGIYLVDGLGHGVKINSSKNNHQQQMRMNNEPSIHQYGLPPAPIQTGDKSNSQNFHHSKSMSMPSSLPISMMTSTAVSTTTTSNGNNGMNLNNATPLCIRIDANNSTTSTGNVIAQPNMNTNENRFQQQQHQQHTIQTQTGNMDCTAIIPIPMPRGSIVPKSNTNFNANAGSNTVMLPVPSPIQSYSIPNQNFVNSFSSSRMEVGMTTSPSPVTIIKTPASSPQHQQIINVGSSTPSQSQSTVTERTLISTEAQTEDLPTIAPPPPVRNREQRKRERRERRNRSANNDGHSSNHHNQNQNQRSSSASRNHPEQAQIHRQNSNNSCDNNNPPNHHHHHDGRISRIGRCSPNSHHQFPPSLMNDLNLNIENCPPYSTLPQGCDRRLPNVPMLHQQPPMPTCGPGIMTQIPPPLLGPSPCSQPQPVRYHFGPNSRASRRSLRTPRGIPYASEEEPKSCCGMSTSQAVSIRWFIIVIAIIGICCTVAGTALGAARTHGNQHLTLSLLMIGVGVVLLTVSAVAWRLTANESSTSCRAMLGFARTGSRGDGGSEPNRRFVPRLPPYAGRSHHPFAAMMYPEFQYRPPPPSYQASMQEYRLRLLLLERSNPTMAAAAALGSPSGLSMVPPPAYRPYTGYRLNIPQEIDYSRPPSYRSNQAQYSEHQIHMNMNMNDPCIIRGSGGDVGNTCSGAGRRDLIESSSMTHSHSRDPSILSYLSGQSVVGGDNVSVVSAETHHQVVGIRSQNSTVVSVMQAVNVGMDITHHGHHITQYEGDEDDNGKCDPSCRVEEVDDEKLDSSNNNRRKSSKELTKIDKKKKNAGQQNNCHKDENFVRIVQTDSSQVIGSRDSVIVTVSGSNNSLWNQSIQVNSTNNNNSTTIVPVRADNNTGNSEVQILAHL